MRAELPSGTVTFLFTDVEGSTKLLHDLGAEAYADALAEHRRLIREVCTAEGGVEVDTQGDAFFFAFPTAPGALAAAAALTDRLSDGPIRVRVGLHTGTPLLTEEGYVGDDVHRAARIAASGHGGQVLVSASTASLAETDELVDLGEHRFKDLAAPERVYQLGDEAFPSLRSLYRSNLPLAAHPLIGRKKELVDVLRLLRGDARLITVTGAGGVGKTRFALAAAAEAADEFPDGVWFVPLAPLRDPELVLPTVAEAVGARGDLARHLGNDESLLFLDNLEHVVEAAPALATLVAACPRLRLLVTSREALRVAVEREYPLSPLPESPSVELFRQRASAVAPELEIAYAAAAEICDRLDRLPLAIELAAARCRALSPAQILERLSHRLDLLKGGRDAEPRQQTLRATIEWSYELLPAEERERLAALAVFRGGWTIEAADAVCSAGLDVLESLVEKSLLRFTGERYWLLETIREFAAERLADGGRELDLQRRHASYFLELGESLGLSVDAFDPSTPQRHDVALSELDNFRAAMEWGLDHDPAVGLRIAIALEQHFVVYDPREGLHWHETLLARLGEASPELRASALRSVGGLAEFAGRFDAAEEFYEQSFALYEEVGDEWGIVHLRHRLANCALHRGDLASALPIYEENLVRAREIRRGSLEAEALNGLASVAFLSGEFATSYALYREAVERARGLRWTWGEAISLQRLGENALELGRPEEAEEHARAALRLGRAMDGRLTEVRGLALLAAAARVRGDSERAGRLWGAVRADDERRGPVGRPELLTRLVERIVDGDEQFEHGVAAGSTLTLEEAVDQALSSVE